MNAVRTASETTSTAADPPDPGRLFDLPGPHHAPLPSTTDEFSSAMDVSEAVVTDLNNAAGIVPLVSSLIVVPHAPTSTPSYNDTLLASVSAASRPAVDSIDDEEFTAGRHSSGSHRPPPPPSTEAFGPWMLVERRQRRNIHKAANHTSPPASSPRSAVVQGSRFNPIFEENLGTAPTSADANSRAATAVTTIGADVPFDPMVTPVATSSPLVVRNVVVAPPSSKPPIPQSRGKESAKLLKSSAKPGDQAKHLALPLRKSVSVQRPSIASTSKSTTLTSRRNSTLSSARFAPSLGRHPNPKGDRLLDDVLRDKNSRPFLLGIVEPRISGARADSIIAAFGFHSSHRIEAVGFSGGLWLCWHESLRVEVLVHNFQFMHCRVTCLNTGSSSLVTLVYASPSVSKRKILWPHLRSFASSIREPWLLMGDFNATLDASERKGGADAVRPSRDFQSFLFDCGLRDMGYQGPDFTWSRGATLARLDRMLCNNYWDESFPEAAVSHLFRMRSDHRPLLLTVGPSHGPYSVRQFRYFSGWHSHADFHRMVQDNWKSMSSLFESIKAFTTAAEVWNTSVFGYIGAKKRSIIARLRGAQRALAHRHSSFLVHLEHDLQLELESLHDQEELLWRQKSRSDWVLQGDHNTAYFHRTAKQRKVRNRITSLQLPDGSWCDDENILRSEAANFFRDLFLDHGHASSTPFPFSRCFPVMPQNVLDSLATAPSFSEASQACYACAYSLGAN
ncbi:hypothetical protein V6N13_043625 [Hibiscus sabdariffa]